MQFFYIAIFLHNPGLQLIGEGWGGKGRRYGAERRFGVIAPRNTTQNRPILECEGVQPRSSPWLVMVRGHPLSV
jgi:hypothetical protein